MNMFEKWESEVRGYCRLYPTVFASATNAHQVDEAGNRYLDFFAGAGVLNFGHNNLRMKKAIIEFLEADGVAHSLDMYTTAKRDFVTAFVETILQPRDMDYKMQFTGPTGTNAVEAALKLARNITGRANVVAFSQGFHGMTLGALACTANSKFRDAAGVSLEHVYRAPFDTNVGGGMQGLATLRASFENSSSGYAPPAAFLVEAVQAEGGVNAASAEWLRGVQALARDLGALFIIDDIQVGCGRTGPYFSFEDMGLDPDIICLAKGVGGYGTPLAFNLIKPDRDRHWQPGQHTGTFRGQGISFVAGREALRYFEDDALCEQTRERGKRIAARLREVTARYSDRNFEARGVGMIQGLDVRDGALAKAIVKACFANGLLVGACGVDGSVLKLMPPLTIEDADLESGLNVLVAAVEHAVGEAV